MGLKIMSIMGIFAKIIIDSASKKERFCRFFPLSSDRVGVQYFRKAC